MPEIIRTRERVYRGDYSSDDERSSSYGGPAKSYTTVQKYRVTPSRQLRVADDDDDRMSMRSDRLEVGTRHHRLEVDRRSERSEQIERPRSALEYRESPREREVKRTVVYERERPREPLSPRGWEQDRGLTSERDREIDVRVEKRERETDVRVEKRESRRERDEPVEYERVERRERETRRERDDEPVEYERVEKRERESRRERDDEPVEYERVSRQTDYYGRPEPMPLVVREPPTEKYEVVRREQFVENREVAPPRRQEDEYYYRRDVRDVRDVQPRRDEVARYDRREARQKESASDDDDESVVYERKERKVVRDRSHSPRHKLHLAEGALAGAAATALIANHREKSGGVSEHRGRKAVGGALAGALGAELITRARSRYRDRSGSRSRSRSSSRGGGHSKLKTGLALAATALAAAAAGKYISNRNERKEEAGRGRSRTRSVSRRRRYSSDDAGSENIGKHNNKNRAATIAKAAGGAAVVGAIAEHIRNKSRGRSKSALRTGGVAAATGLAGAAIAGIYEARKAKQDASEAESGRGRKQSSRSRSRPRSFVYDEHERAIDPELGMVEYGTQPVYTHPGAYYDPAAAAAERSRERRSSRSRSRVRDIAGGAIATGAAAIGITQYQQRRERKKAERERREAERERRRYEEEASPPEENYYAQGYDDRYTPSPPHASGGAHYNESPLQGPPGGYTQPPQTMHVEGYPPQPPFDPAHPYDPAHQAPYDAAAFPAGPPPPVDQYGYPPREATREATREAARDGGNVSSTTPFAPQAQTPPSRALFNLSDEEAHIMTPSTSSGSRTVSPITADNHPHNKSVTFAPISPSSTRTLATSRSRRNSDPSSDRSNITPQPAHRHRRRRRHHHDDDPSRSPSPTASSLDEVEVLPDRFDRKGRRLDLDRDANKGHHAAAGQQSSGPGEMVERIVHDFGDVLEGRQSWKSLLKGLFEEPGGGGGGSRRSR